MSPLLRYAVALTLAGLSIGVLLVVLILTEDTAEKPEKKWLVREIAAAPPPPPPPPPAPQQPQQDDVISLDIDVGEAGQALAITVARAKVDDISVEPVLESPSFDATNWAFDWQQNLKTFGLGDLDTIPRLLTAPRLKFPDSLYRRGVSQARAKLHVLIDEQGRVVLKSIKYLQYPELKQGVLRAVRMARFTAPRKDGQPARAEFIWPVELISDSRTAR